MASPTPLGRFLRARREAAVPRDVAREPGRSVRRTSGLRREEVAARAAMSPDYYTRLEQGRERSPSARVLEALGRALELDETEAGHLFDLARHGERSSRSMLPRIPQASGTATAGLPDLVHQFNGPALAVDVWADVLLCNRLASVLHHDLGPGDNLIRSTFLDERMRELFADWEDAAECCAGMLRLAYGRHPEHPRFGRLFAELSTSEDFRRHWSHHGVVRKACGRKRFHHPAAGILDLAYTSLAVEESPGLQLLVYRPVPGAEQAYERFAAAARGPVARRRIGSGTLR